MKSCHFFHHVCWYYVERNRLTRKEKMLYNFTYIWIYKITLMNKLKQKKTHRYREPTDNCQWRRRGQEIGKKDEEK